MNECYVIIQWRWHSNKQLRIIDRMVDRLGIFFISGESKVMWQARYGYVLVLLLNDEVFCIVRVWYRMEFSIFATILVNVCYEGMISCRLVNIIFPLSLARIDNRFISIHSCKFYQILGNMLVNECFILFCSKLYIIFKGNQVPSCPHLAVNRNLTTHVIWISVARTHISV